MGCLQFLRAVEEAFLEPVRDPELQGMVGTVPAGILLPPMPSVPQTQPSGGGECHLHEDLSVS